MALSGQPSAPGIELTIGKSGSQPFPEKIIIPFWDKMAYCQIYFIPKKVLFNSLHHSNPSTQGPPAFAISPPISLALAFNLLSLSLMFCHSVVII